MLGSQAKRTIILEKECASLGLITLSVPCLVPDDALTAHGSGFLARTFQFNSYQAVKLFLSRCCSLVLQISLQHFYIGRIPPAPNKLDTRYHSRRDLTTCPIESHPIPIPIQRRELALQSVPRRRSLSLPLQCSALIVTPNCPHPRPVF